MLYSTPSVIAIGVLSIFIAKGAYGLVVTQHESAKERDLLTVKVNEETLREGELSQALAKLQTGEGQEEELKSKFNVAKNGEHVAIILDAKEATSTNSENGGSWWQKLLGAIIFWK